MISRYLLTLLIFLVISIDIFGQSNLNINNKKNQRVKNAYGYLIGQEYSINIIKSKFPNLAINATLAKTKFDATFEGAKNKIKDYLTIHMGDSLFKVFFDTVLLEAKKITSQIELTEEIAIASIEEINNRATGQIPSPTLETLLYFKYLDKPENEFTDGYTQLFKTKGHIKSKGTDWQIKVPLSWKAQEGERPNIIQKFISDYGDGKQSISLIVKDLNLPKGYIPTKKDLSEMFTEKGMKEMVDEDSKFISSTKMTFDSNIGGMLEIEKVISRLDLKAKIRMARFIFINNGKMYFLNGTIITDNLNEDLSIQMKKILPLYKLVANSIIINDQYK